VVVGCAAPGPEEGGEAVATPDVAAGGSPEEDIQAVVAAHTALVEAYEAGDIEAFAARLDPGAELLLFHPRADNRFDDIDDLREAMPRMFENIENAVWTDAHALVSVEGDVGWVTAEFLLEADGLAQPFVGRSTEIWARRDGEWRLVHAHWSQNPQQRS
jgi:ketosteroid isomerase-like protein